MFCYNCGCITDSAFCSECGTKMIESDSMIIHSWRKESDFKKLAQHPEVLELIIAHAQLSNNKITSSFLLDKFDFILGSFTGVSANLIGEIVVPIYRGMGMKVVNMKEGAFNESINELFVKSLCSISSNKKLDFKEFYQAKDGLVIVSVIKSDFITYKGSLVIKFQQRDNEIGVEINAAIKGQVIDFGKSRKLAEQVLSDLKTIELI